MLAIDESKKYIESIDFSRIIDKLITHSGWLKQDAIETAKQYRNFLFLNRKYCNEGNPLPPSEDIDEFWHSHILDTNAYIRDCNYIFGRYIHHYPYFGIDESSTMMDLNYSFEQAKELYLKEFGEILKATRSSYPKFLYFIMWKIERFLKHFEFNKKLEKVDVLR